MGIRETIDVMNRLGSGLKLLGRLPDRPASEGAIMRVERDDWFLTMHEFQEEWK